MQGDPGGAPGGGRPGYTVASVSSRTRAAGAATPSCRRGVTSVREGAAGQAEAGERRDPRAAWEAARTRNQERGRPGRRVGRRGKGGLRFRRGRATGRGPRERGTTGSGSGLGAGEQRVSGGQRASPGPDSPLTHRGRGDLPPRSPSGPPGQEGAGQRLFLSLSVSDGRAWSPIPRKQLPRVTLWSPWGASPFRSCKKHAASQHAAGSS